MHRGASQRIRQTKAQFRRLETEIIDLQIDVARVEAGDLQPLPAIRADAERILFMMRDLLIKEADLVYERFRDVGAGD